MRGVERVYHCAAVISFLPEEHQQMTKANVEGTANVMNAALNNGIKKAVHVSSVAAFGIAPENKLIDEKFFDPQIAKRFAYYKSKHFAEREAWRANAEGLDLIVVCPSTILGAGWWNAQPNSLFRDIYNGLKFYTSSTNGFVDVRDVAECMYRLMNSEISGEKFIVSSENLSFREVMWMMADELNTARPPLEAGKFLREIAWRTEAVKHFFSNQPLLITRESAEVASINFLYNNEKIKQALGYNFKPLKETIADTSRVFLQSQKEGKPFGTFI
jgi:nucleoside-diphosphate-sugar epimerase